MTQLHKYTSQNKHRVTIHKIHRRIRSEVTYTSTLPLNQEGILPTQFSALVFFSASTGSSSSSSHLHLQVIFIFKSSRSGSSLDLDDHRTSSQDLDHHSIWIIITGLDLDHHSIWIISLDRIWIITRSGSLLLDLDHHSIWISRIHHNWIWIITRSGSSLVIIMCVISRHRKFYRTSPFSCWLQAQPTLGLWQPLYLTYSSEWLELTSDMGGI